MFSTIVSSVNGHSSFDDSSVHGVNKSSGGGYYAPAPKVASKVYFGDRFVSGKFLKAGYY